MRYQFDLKTPSIKKIAVAAARRFYIDNLQVDDSLAHSKSTTNQPNQT